MPRPMLIAFQVAEHDGRGGAQTEIMGFAHYVEPLFRVDLVRTNFATNIVVKNFRCRAGQRT